MRIAIVGGTGAFGKGLALRWSAQNEILLGSRSREKAEETARILSEQLKAQNLNAKPVTGHDNREAVLLFEVVVTLREVPVFSRAAGLASGNA